MQTECRVHDMASGTDYRKLAQRQKGLYFVAEDKEQLLEEQVCVSGACILATCQICILIAAAACGVSS